MKIIIEIKVPCDYFLTILSRYNLRDVYKADEIEQKLGVTSSALLRKTLY